MVARADILAGRAVILIDIQDGIDKQLRTIRSKMRMFSNSLSEFGGDLFRGGLAGSAAAFFPVKDFVSFQDTILFLQSKLKDTGVDIIQLEKYIRMLGATTSFTSKEVGEAAAVLAQAGLGAKVQGALLPTLDLARGARVELDVAGRLLANILTGYDIAAERANEVASKLTTAARLGTLNIIDIGESLKESLTTFRQLGVPLEDALGMFVQLSNVSLRATKAGTSLNTAFANLAKSGDKLAGLNVQIDVEDLKDATVLFKKLVSGFSDPNAFKNVEALQNIFNLRGARGIGGIQIQGLEDLDKVIKEIKNSTDEARTSAQLLDSRLGGVFRRALSAGQELLLSIGSSTEGPLTKLGEAAAGTFNSFSDLAKKSPEVAQTLLLIPPAALAAGTSLLALGYAFNKVASFLTPLINLTNLFFTTVAKIAALNLAGLSNFTGAFGKAGILKSTFNPSVDIAKPFIALGNALEQVGESRTLKSLRTTVVDLAKNSTGLKTVADNFKKIATAGILLRKNKRVEEGIISPELFKPEKFIPKKLDLPIINPDFKLQLPLVTKSFQYQLPIINREFSVPIATKIARQIELGLQQELDFGNAIGKNRPAIADFLKFPPQRLKSSSGKFLARSTQDQVQELVQSLRGLKGYRNVPLNAVIDDAFTAFDLSDAAKKTFRFNILNNLRESLPTGRQLELVLQNDLPVLNRNFKLKKDIIPRQLSLFDNLTDTLPEANKSIKQEFQRFYSAGFTEWLTPDPVYAKGFAKGQGYKTIGFVDILKDSLLLEGKAVSEYADQVAMSPYAFTNFKSNDAVRLQLQLVENIDAEIAAMAGTKGKITKVIESREAITKAFAAKTVSSNIEGVFIQASKFNARNLPAFSLGDIPELKEPLRARGGKGAFAARQAAIQDRVAATIGKQTVKIPGSSRLAAVKKIFKGFFTGTAETSLIAEGFSELFAKGATKSFKAGSAVKATKSIGIFNVLKSAFSVLFPKGASLANLGLSKALSDIGSAIKAVFNVNYLAKFIAGTKSILGFVTKILGGLLKFGRFAFSFNGITAALQFIILFGDKIPFIRNSVSALGKGFSAAFGQFAETGRQLAPVFSLISQGFQDIFAGNGEGGFESIGKAFSYAADIIANGFSNAWKAFLKEIEPGANIIKAIFEGTLGVINALVNTVASVFGTVLKNGEIVIKGDGTLLETIKQAFSLDNIKIFFGSIVEFITSIGQSLNTILGAVVSVLNLSKQGIIAILQVAGAVGNKSAQASLAALDENSPRRKALEDAKIGLKNNADLEKQRNIDKFNAANNLPFFQREALGKLISKQNFEIDRKLQLQLEQLDREIAALGPAYGTFTFTVDEANRLLQEANDKLIAKINGITGVDTTLTPPVKINEPTLALPPKDAGESLFNFPKDLSAFGPSILTITPVPDLKLQAAQIAAAMPAIGKALVGSYGDTQGNLLQMVPTLEKLQEEANKHLEGIEDGMDMLASNTQPFVFNA